MILPSDKRSNVAHGFLKNNFAQVRHCASIHIRLLGFGCTVYVYQPNLLL